ncbi:MAG: DUF6427 family protein [Bacteroidota bacterium]
MLSRFFKNSKPIVFLVLALVMAVVFVLVNLQAVNSWSLKLSFSIASFLLYLAMLFVLNFVLKRNKIHQQNTYGGLAFVLLTTAFPVILTDIEALIGGLLLLFSIRRILSLGTQQNTKKKIFEAAFWLFFVSVIYPWTVLIYPVIFIAVGIYVPHNYRNFILPIIGFFTAHLLTNLYFILVYDQWFSWLSVLTEMSFSLNWYRTTQILIPLAIAFFISLLGILSLPKIMRKAKSRLKNNLFLVALIYMLLSLPIVFYTDKTGSELILFAIPSAILIGNLLQLKMKLFIKESLIWILIITSLLHWFL